MADDDDITREYLQSILLYDPETGILKWKPRPVGKHWTDRTWNTRWAGKEAGYSNEYGYRIVTICGKKIRGHRIIWKIMTGSWPPYHIDHEDGNTSGNIFSNIREATRAENMQNLKIPKTNKSGFMGVSWHDRSNKWQASIRYSGKSVGLGLFEDAREAHEAYLEAKRKFHPFNPIPRQPVTLVETDG